jgi:hypothetical protein
MYKIIFKTSLSLLCWATSIFLIGCAVNQVKAEAADDLVRDVSKAVHIYVIRASPNRAYVIHDSSISLKELRSLFEKTQLFQNSDGKEEVLHFGKPKVVVMGERAEATVNFSYKGHNLEKKYSLRLDIRKEWVVDKEEISKM